MGAVLLAAFAINWNRLRLISIVNYHVSKLGGKVLCQLWICDQWLDGWHYAWITHFQLTPIEFAKEAVRFDGLFKVI